MYLFALHVIKGVFSERGRVVWTIFSFKCHNYYSALWYVVRAIFEICFWAVVFELGVIYRESYKVPLTHVHLAIPPVCQLRCTVSDEPTADYYSCFPIKQVPEFIKDWRCSLLAYRFMWIKWKFASCFVLSVGFTRYTIGKSCAQRKLGQRNDRNDFRLSPSVL